MHRGWSSGLAILVLVLAGCSSSAGSDASITPATGSTGVTTSPALTAVSTVQTTVATTTTSTTSSPPTTSTTTPSTTSTSPSTSSTSTTSTAPGTTPVPAPSTSPATTATTATATATATATESRTIGTSIEGRPITALRRGAAGGHVVLVIGVIHGDEDAGLAITDRLAAMPLPDDIDLWVVPSMNPDGQAAHERHNADQVDLNRNFPYQWGKIGAPGDPEYAGPSAASEPETQAMVAFISEVHPEMVIWYHQDLDRIAPSTGRDGQIRARYAELTSVPLLGITGGRYTGVAATWARHELDGGVAFIVELGASLTDEQADRHAAAVVTVAGEL